MENKTIIIGGAVLAGGALLYWYWLKQQQPSVIATAIPAPTPAGTLAGTSSTTPLASVPSVSVSTSTPVAASAAAAAVTQWANVGLGPNNLAQFNKALPSMTTDEINQLNNIITNNLWGTPDATAFWNTWRTKYHILDGTVSNFADAGRVSELLNYRWAA